MKRRKFLQYTVAGAASAVFPTAAWAAPPSSHLPMLAETDLLTILRDHGRVQRIGDLYRRRNPLEDDPEMLETLILEGTSGPKRRDALRAEIARKVTADFEAERTVRMDGWILARTEARQCALYSMYAPADESIPLPTL